MPRPASGSAPRRCCPAAPRCGMRGSRRHASGTACGSTRARPGRRTSRPRRSVGASRPSPRVRVAPWSRAGSRHSDADRPGRSPIGVRQKTLEPAPRPRHPKALLRARRALAPALPGGLAARQHPSRCLPVEDSVTTEAEVLDEPVVAGEPLRPRTPEEIERHWFENVYQGDRMKQLTVRSVIMGMMLGGIMACSNVYVSLKTGWSLGVAITSCILAYSIFAGLQKILPRWFGGDNILQDNAMQSFASAAGTMTSAGLSNAIPALMMLNPGLLPTDFGTRMMWLIPWVILISWMGVFIAVPTKRQVINVEQLPFPTGTAAAATLRSLHAHGDSAARQARSLFAALGLGGLITVIRSADAPWLIKTPIAWQPTRSLFTDVS